MTLSPRFCPSTQPCREFAARRRLFTLEGCHVSQARQSLLMLRCLPLEVTRRRHKLGCQQQFFRSAHKFEIQTYLDAVMLRREKRIIGSIEQVEKLLRQCKPNGIHNRNGSRAISTKALGKVTSKGRKVELEPSILRPEAYRRGLDSCLTKRL